MYQEAIALIETENLHELPVIVCWAKSWHPGLIGLMAGKIAERYHRPAVVLALNEEGKAKGSCRSTKTVTILKILKHAKVLDLYSKKLDGAPIVGGHAFAAGMEVPEKNLLEFRQAICDTLLELNPDFKPGHRIFFADSRIVPNDINDNTFDALQGLAPFGAGHTDPIFWLRNVVVAEQQLMSSDKHLKLILSHDSFKYKKVSAVLWHKAKDYPENYVGKKINLLFTFGKETRGYGSKFYLSIVDLKICE
jgi:single-stranded-DNA-specific exonuclease